MNRPRTLLVLAVLLAGCRSAPQGDPFLLGRSTIPPPSTGAIGPNGVQPSLAPPVVTAPPAMAVPANPPPLNASPLAPPPSSMSAPPETNPYNFHQGSLKSSSADNLAGNWTPSGQRVTTKNRAADSNAAPTIVTASKPTGASEVDAAPEPEPETATAEFSKSSTAQSEIKITSFEDSTVRTASAKSVSAASEPAHFVPAGTVIRIVEPEAKSAADSAQAKPTSSMTAGSFHPQWHKWTESATE